MCGGVRRHVTQSWLERAQRAMHDELATAIEFNQRLEASRFARTGKRRSFADTAATEDRRRIEWLDKHLDKRGAP